MSSTHAFPKPTAFLTVRCHKPDWLPSLCGLCVGYENKIWRNEALADHIVQWLPEFALTPKEWTGLNSANAVELIRKAAQTVYQTDRFSKRGEFGELFLHAAIRQVHDSLPAISKIYYKSAVNDTVKGFDAVHVVGPPGDMELWLGEAKFYDNASKAISDVTAEIQSHLSTDYLRSEFILIANKIDDRWPHAPALRQLISKETSLDVIFKRACIPVLLTYDSASVNSYSECSPEFESSFNDELVGLHDAFKKSLTKKTIPLEVRVHLFLMPLNHKPTLVAALDRKLKAWQGL
ncbi:MAG TPA: DUF1837 domain-containing protein [Gemmatales bacterium]|nr:DUF1837 domain-containing protein [Gemmatales bacterium]